MAVCIRIVIRIGIRHRHRKYDVFFALVLSEKVLIVRMVMVSSLLLLSEFNNDACCGGCWCCSGGTASSIVWSMLARMRKWNNDNEYTVL